MVSFKVIKLDAESSHLSQQQPGVQQALQLAVVHRKITTYTKHYLRITDLLFSMLVSGIILVEGKLFCVACQKRVDLNKIQEEQINHSTEHSNFKTPVAKFIFQMNQVLDMLHTFNCVKKIATSDSYQRMNFYN